MNHGLSQPTAAWTLRQALIIILAISLVEEGAQLLGLVSFSGPTTLLILTAVDALLYIGGIYLFVRSITAGSPWTLLGLHTKSSLPSALLGLPVGFVTALVVWGTGWFITAVIGKDPGQQAVQQAFEQAAQNWQFWLLAFAATVMVPIKEEVIFRGFLYPSLRNRVGITWGILLTSVFFAASHGDLIRFVPLLIGGILLNILFVRTGSLYSSIVAHAVWNGAMGLAVMLWR